MKNIEIISAQGLVCDNEKCDFEDMSIKQSDYKQWVNKPCPKCGENLLTEQDFINAEALQAAIGIVNSLSKNELEELSSVIDIEELKQSGIFENPQDLDTLLKSDKGYIVSVETHKNIKIKGIDNETNI